MVGFAAVADALLNNGNDPVPNMDVVVSMAIFREASYNPVALFNKLDPETELTSKS
jgi:hypothetical protein